MKVARSVVVAAGLIFVLAQSALAQGVSRSVCKILDYEFTFGFAVNVNGQKLVCNNAFFWQPGQNEPATAFCIHGSKLFSEGSRVVTSGTQLTCNGEGTWEVAN